MSQNFGIFVWDFLWRGGGGEGVYIAFLAYAMVWDGANGAGFPGTDQCHLGWGIPDQPQGRRPEDLGHRADERKPSFLAQARKTTSSER